MKATTAIHPSAELIADDRARPEERRRDRRRRDEHARSRPQLVDRTLLGIERSARLLECELVALCRVLVRLGHLRP
jgi:hypothetical protein